MKRPLNRAVILGSLTIIIHLLLHTLLISLPIEKEAESLHEYLESRSHLLTKENSLDPLIERAADSKLVLLGESTHGTSEYYLWRAEISQRLIAEHNFAFIVVEGDWPSFYQINRYVKGLDHHEATAGRLLREHFNRWPQWMWANEEMIDLIEWIREFNLTRPAGQKVGIYGMDVYSKEGSIREVRNYLAARGDDRSGDVAGLYDCFTPHNYDGGTYARAIYRGMTDCSEQVVQVVDYFLSHREQLSAEDRDAYLNAKQNAYIVKNAEKHYRSAISRGPESWNQRVFHMEQTLYRLLDFYGQDAKGIVWAHNTHIGDSRYTPMERQGSYNIGQLTREELGRERVFSIGFGCYSGRVLAGSSWESARQTMSIPRAKNNSLEALFKDLSPRDFYLIFDSNDREHPVLSRHIDHRAIGVVYNPRQETGNYVPTILPERYDAFIFIEETNPLSPLH